MSNNNTTFRLQSFGTSSAFDPHIIDNCRNADVADLGLVSLQRSTGPTFKFNNDTSVLFFAVNYCSNGSTSVSSLTLPVRCLYLGSSVSALTGQLWFYNFPDITGNPGLLQAVDAVQTSFVGHSFSLTGANVVEGYVTISFPTITLPAATLLTGGGISPTYIGIKLTSVNSTNGKYLVTNAQRGSNVNPSPATSVAVVNTSDAFIVTSGGTSIPPTIGGPVIVTSTTPLAYNYALSNPTSNAVLSTNFYTTNLAEPVIVPELYVV